MTGRALLKKLLSDVDLGLLYRDPLLVTPGMRCALIATCEIAAGSENFELRVDPASHGSSSLVDLVARQGDMVGIEAEVAQWLRDLASKGLLEPGEDGRSLIVPVPVVVRDAMAVTP